MNKDYGPGNAPEDYNNMNADEKAKLDRWIKEKFVPAKSKKMDSYYLKHVMEHENGLYVTNGQFKGAMQAAGYKAYDIGNINWDYKVKFKKL